MYPAMTNDILCCLLLFFRGRYIIFHEKWYSFFYIFSHKKKLCLWMANLAMSFIQCFDAVGWVTGRASDPPMKTLCRLCPKVLSWNKRVKGSRVERRMTEVCPEDRPLKRTRWFVDRSVQPAGGDWSVPRQLPALLLRPGNGTLRVVRLRRLPW